MEDILNNECELGPLLLAVKNWIKMEPEVNPLGLQAYNNTYKIEENKGLTEEGYSSDQLMTNVKTEYVDDSYDLISEIKVEEGQVLFDLLPVVKCEAEKDSFDLDRVKKELKLEASADEIEVFDSIADNFEESVSRKCEDILREEDKSTQSSRHILGGSIGVQRPLQFQELKAFHDTPNSEESRTIQNLRLGASYVVCWELAKALKTLVNL
ncbi:uncharacterized protein [Periplaneta americana]|uniref:uncharacterized protein isoform X4 n=1 Tax=Periplaneta americana TaxID=6978 RepID=UPI0037E84809